MLKLNNQKPIYIQIAEYFEELILNGVLEPSSVLPSQRNLALELNINRSTVTSAYEELKASGLVVTCKGGRTIVNESMWELDPDKFMNWNLFKKRLYSPITVLTKRILEEQHNPNNINLVNGNFKKEIMFSESLPKFNSFDFLNNTKVKLKQEILSVLSETNNIRVKDENQLLLVSSIHQALLLIIKSLLNPGDAVAIECPSYLYSIKLFSISGIKMVRLNVDDEGIKPEEIISLYKKHRIKLVFVNPTFQNPSGTILSHTRRKKLTEICSELNIPIVEFDFFSMMTDKKRLVPNPLITYDKNQSIVINMGSFSNYITPNVRVGWIIAPIGLLDRLKEYKYEMGAEPAELTQQILMSFLSKSDYIKTLNDYSKELSIRRNWMVQYLQEYLGSRLSFIEPLGGKNIWGKIDTDLSDRALFEGAISHQVLIAPGQIYGAEKGFIRLSYNLQTKEELEEGIKRLKKVISN